MQKNSNEKLTAAQYQDLQKTGLKKSKYGNKKVTVDDFVFDSQKEAKVYLELKQRHNAGEIDNLMRQVKVPIVINKQKICTYIADFSFTDCKTKKYVLVDVKSVITRKLPVYRLKNKLVKAIHGITITEM